MKKIILFLCISTSLSIYGQQNHNYWQQHVDYTMDIDVDVTKFQYKGTQKLVYTNNSPDELSHVYYHLYFEFWYVINDCNFVD